MDGRKEGRMDGCCWINAGACESKTFFGRLSSVCNMLLKTGRKQHWRAVILQSTKVRAFSLKCLWRGSNNSNYPLP